MNFLNDKLYNQYYPIESNVEKNNFLESNRAEVLKFVRNIGSIAKNQLCTIEYDYATRMRPTKSFFGHPKCRNIVHNMFVEHERSNDGRFQQISEDLSELGSLEDNITYHKWENISIDDVNCILEVKNLLKHKFLIQILLLLILSLVLLVIPLDWL